MALASHSHATTWSSPSSPTRAPPLSAKVVRDCFSSDLGATLANRSRFPSRPEVSFDHWRAAHPVATVRVLSRAASTLCLTPSSPANYAHLCAASRARAHKRAPPVAGSRWRPYFNAASHHRDPRSVSRGPWGQTQGGRKGHSRESRTTARRPCCYRRVRRRRRCPAAVLRIFEAPAPDTEPGGVRRRAGQQPSPRSLACKVTARAGCVDGRVHRGRVPREGPDHVPAHSVVLIPA